MSVNKSVSVTLLRNLNNKSLMRNYNFIFETKSTNCKAFENDKSNLILMIHPSYYSCSHNFFSGFDAGIKIFHGFKKTDITTPLICNPPVRLPIKKFIAGKFIIRRNVIDNPIVVKATNIRM